MTATRWEYCTLEGSDYTFKGFTDRLNILGKAGWELVTVTAIEREMDCDVENATFVAFLKRPKQEDPRP